MSLLNASVEDIPEVQRSTISEDAVIALNMYSVDAEIAVGLDDLRA